MAGISVKYDHVEKTDKELVEEILKYLSGVQVEDFSGWITLDGLKEDLLLYLEDKIPCSRAHRIKKTSFGIEWNIPYRGVDKIVEALGIYPGQNIPNYVPADNYPSTCTQQYRVWISEMPSVLMPKMPSFYLTISPDYRLGRILSNNTGEHQQREFIQSLRVGWDLILYPINKLLGREPVIWNPETQKVIPSDMVHALTNLDLSLDEKVKLITETGIFSF